VPNEEFVSQRKKMDAEYREELEIVQRGKFTGAENY
jgi:hypothetical protein